MKVWQEQCLASLSNPDNYKRACYNLSSDDTGDTDELTQKLASIVIELLEYKFMYESCSK